MKKVSLPVRGAWIEMGNDYNLLYRIRGSLPVRGAWIEMCIIENISFCF